MMIVGANSPHGSFVRDAHRPPVCERSGKES